MKQFFKIMLASLTGLILGILVITLISIGILSSLGEKEKGYEVKDNSILQIKLDREIVDRASKNPFDNIEIPGFDGDKKIGLNDILSSIKKAKTDDRIKGIYLDLKGIPSGLGTLVEIRNALIDFKESEKWIISYSEFYTHKSYYLATVADEIYLYPEGEIDFKGFRSERMFFKGALEKLEIEPQIIRGRNNKFKSAVEPLMYDKMSEANREQTEKYLGSMWDHVVSGISETRGITGENLNLYADSLFIQSSEDAIKYKLVDKAMYKDQILALLREKLEIDEKDKINTARLSKYVDAKDPSKKFDKEKMKNKDKIAVVYASGSIESGKGDEETIGSETIAKAIRKARLDTTVKAIVFRVNSPGGSALASDVMWRETILAKEAKPFIVSMGDVAASGGYYISCASDRIFANPTTITGSIGVFGVLPNMKDFYNNKLGITFDRVLTNEHSDMGTVARSLDDFERKTIQLSVEKIYSDFTQKVANGRNMTQEAVDAIGQGRVWTGIDAKEIGLIDEFGGLTEAIDYAAKAAEIEDYKLKSFPEEKDPFDEIMKELSGQAETYFMKNRLGDQYKYYQQIETIRNMKGIQMRLPFAIDIK